MEYPAFQEISLTALHWKKFRAALGDGDDCFELELTDEGSMSASKIFDAELAAASCPQAS